VVGECKATKHERLGVSAYDQLIRLVNTHLAVSYQDCIKIIVVGGELTKPARDSAQKNAINVIRPEELQRLVILKRQYPNAVNLYQLKSVFEKDVFGQEANENLKKFIDNIWGQLIKRSEWVELVRDAQRNRLGKPVHLEDIFAHSRTTKPEITLNSDMERGLARDLLIELSSPLLGYLNRVEDRFEFVKSLEIQD
jgi:hypothetical protein